MHSDQSDSSHDPRWRLTVTIWVLVCLLLGVLSVKRILNGNADLSGNYQVWRANLVKPTQPGRLLSNELRLRDPDPYPPITYALYSPLARLPLWLLATCWFLMNLACSYYLWRSLGQLLDDMSATANSSVHASCANSNEVGTSPIPESSLLVNQSPEHQMTDIGTRRFLTNTRIRQLAAFGVLPSWVGTLLIGQNTLLLMTLIVATFRMNYRRLAECIAAGTFLALAVVMKVLPAVFLFSFLIRGQIRILVGFGLAICVLIFGLGSLFFGVDKNFEFHGRWLLFAAYGPEDRPPDPRDPNTLRGSLRDKNQAVEAVLARLFMNIPIHGNANAPHVNIESVTAATWRIMSSSVTVGFVLLGMIAVGSGLRARQKLLASSTPNPPGTKGGAAGRVGSLLGQLSILSLMQMFISPVLWSHYYLWVLFPLTFVLFETRQGRSSGMWIYGMWSLALPGLGLELCRAVGLQLWVNAVMYIWICWPAVQRLIPVSRTRLNS